MKHNYSIAMEKVPNHKGLNENITSTVVYVSSMKIVYSTLLWNLHQLEDKVVDEVAHEEQKVQFQRM